MAAVIFLYVCSTYQNAAYSTAIFDPESTGTVAVEEDGKLFVEDRQNQYRLHIPAPYWRYMTPQHLQRQRGPAPGGCAPGDSVPASLLLIIQNRDAPSTAVSLERMPYRFLMRGREDLTDYLGKQESALLEQMRGTGKLISSNTEFRNGMIVYTAFYSFTDPESEQELKVVLTNFLVRPPQEDIIVYQLQAFTPLEWHPLLEKDFDAMINGFQYTGRSTEQFFVPDAPEDKLPFAAGTSRPAAPHCGENLPGIIMAIAAVIIIYMLLKKKLRTG